MLELDPKKLNELNQYGKNLRKDSCYIIHNGLIITAVTEMFSDETAGVTVITPTNDVYEENLQMLQGTYVDGKGVFDLYKTVKAPEILDVTRKGITIGNSEQSMLLQKKKKLFRPILDKYKKFRDLPTRNEIGPIDITEAAYETNENKTIYNFWTEPGISARLSKKMIKGYKKNDRVTVSFKETEDGHLFKMIIDVHKKHYIISSMYLIINF